MSFFYNLNDKLNAIRATPEVTHKQLNERDMSRAAKGYEKYGKEGMEALARAGREGKALDPVRKKYDKYDEGAYQAGPDKSQIPAVNRPGNKMTLQDLDKERTQSPTSPEGLKRAQQRLGQQKTTEAAHTPGAGYSPEMQARIKMATPQQLSQMAHELAGDPSHYKNEYRNLEAAQSELRGTTKYEESSAPMTAKQKSFAKLAPPENKITFADKIAGAKKEVDEMLGDVAAEAMKQALGGGRGRDQEMEEASTGNAFDYKNFKQPEKQKPTSFVHKGTYGTEYDGDKDDAQAIRTKKQAAAAAGQGSRGRGRPKKGASVDTGEVMKPDFSAFGDKVKIKPFAGKITKHKMVGEDDLDPEDPGEYDQEGDMAKDSIKTVVRHAQALEKILGDDDNLPEWVQSKLAKIESMMTAVDDYMQNQADDMDDEQEPIAEKAVSKKQQRFMGMVSAAKKGEKPASKEVAKVAKTMKKGDAEDFASTKHKGLPEKAAKKPKEKDVEESTTSGSVATSAAAPKAAKGSGGMTFGKGIYDSMNRELEGMISESMSMNMSMNNDEHGGPTRSLTVTATDEDATRLAQLLKSAGLGGDSGSQGTCSVCGGSSCGCNDMDESYGVNEVSQNAPDYPTNTEQAEDNFEYSGGLNQPKSTGQTTVPVIAGQSGRTGSYAESEQDALQRMMEMSGIREAKAKPDFLDMDKDGDKQEPMKKAVADKKVKVEESDTEFSESIRRMREIAGLDKKAVDEEKTEEGNKFAHNVLKAKEAGKKEADLDGDGDMEKVRESIFTLTNQWKAYKG